MRSEEGAACARDEPRPWDPNCHLRRHPRSLQAPGRAAPGLTRARRSESRNVRTGLSSPESKGAASGPSPSRPAWLHVSASAARVPDAPGKAASNGPRSTPATAPTRTRVPSLTLPASATPNPSPSLPHLRRLRQRWTQETPGSSSPALLDPPLRLTPLVSRQNGARGRALTSRPFPSQFPFHHSLPAGGGMALAPANGRTLTATAVQSPTGTRGFKPITH